jgi:hypothetical protein
MQPKSPNPRRVAAGKHNRKRRGPLTLEGRRRLRQAALRNRPWRYATGPKTAAGKAQAVRNGKKRQVNARSVREIRAELAAVFSLAQEMKRSRQVVQELRDGRPSARVAEIRRSSARGRSSRKTRHSSQPGAEPVEP